MMSIDRIALLEIKELLSGDYSRFFDEFVLRLADKSDEFVSEVIKLCNDFIELHNEDDLALVFMEQLESLEASFDAFSNNERLLKEILLFLRYLLPRDFKINFNNQLLCVYNTITEILITSSYRVQNPDYILEFYRCFKHVRGDYFFELAQISYAMQLLHVYDRDKKKLIDFILSYVPCKDPFWILEKFVAPLQESGEFVHLMVAFVSEKKDEYFPVLLELFSELFNNYRHYLLLMYDYRERFFKYFLILITDCLTKSPDLVLKSVELIDTYQENFIDKLSESFTDWPITKNFIVNLSHCLTFSTVKKTREIIKTLFEDFFIKKSNSDHQLCFILLQCIKHSQNDSLQSFMLYLFRKNYCETYVEKISYDAMEKISLDKNVDTFFNCILLVEEFLNFVIFIKIKHNSEGVVLNSNFYQILMDKFLKVLQNRIPIYKGALDFLQNYNMTLLDQKKINVTVAGGNNLEIRTQLEYIEGLRLKLSLIEFNLNRAFDLFQK